MGIKRGSQKDSKLYKLSAGSVSSLVVKGKTGGAVSLRSGWYSMHLSFIHVNFERLLVPPSGLSMFCDIKFLKSEGSPGVGDINFGK